jgi:gliding motility-associated-like protein
LNLTEKEPIPQTPKTEQSSQTKQTQKEKESLAKQTDNQEDTEENKDEPEEPKPPKIGIPNIFTPNGDGINDFFVIINIEQVENTQLDIFTKEGRVVYSKQSYDNTWDGRGLPDGTYYYIFRFFYEGNQFMRRGSITIKR